MHTLSNLVASAFVADACFDPPKYDSRGLAISLRTSPVCDFCSEVKSVFQWSLASFCCRWRRLSTGQAFMCDGTGLVGGPDLRAAFLESGFDGHIVFWGEVPVVDRHMAFDRMERPFEVRATIAPSERQADFEKLEAEVGPFLSMALLKNTFTAG